MRIAFLTTHLTGSGHLVRTSVLAREAMRAGHEVLLITGGRPLAHLDLSDLTVLQLPALHVRDLDYGTLRCDGGEVAGERHLGTRIAKIRSALRDFEPACLVTETYPLGRRALRDEFEAALQATNAIAVGSVRDIPEPKPRRLADTAYRLQARFAALLVHGSEEFIPLSTSWPFDGLDHIIHHTGYVGDPAKPDALAGGVLVSVGGGTLGRSLLPIAADAARHSTLDWRILIGGPDAHDIYLAPAPNLTVEPARRDYRALLAGARCSISLCGYNTALDLALCDTPAILVPMAKNGEQEQLLRARRLSGFPGFTMLSEDQITPRQLAALADRMSRTRRPKLPIPVNGAQQSIRIIESLGSGE
ncbi:MAG: glycosyltransferase [Pseudomonadota bacterium]